MLIDIKVIKNHDPILNVNCLKYPIMYVEIIDVYHLKNTPLNKSKKSSTVSPS